MEPMSVRFATLDDAPAICTIYNQGIEDRIATFETRPRTAEDVARVWWGIRESILTSFGSDHIAYTLDEKQPGSIWTTRPAFGGTG